MKKKERKKKRLFHMYICFINTQSVSLAPQKNAKLLCMINPSLNWLQTMKSARVRTLLSAAIHHRKGANTKKGDLA